MSASDLQAIVKYLSILGLKTDSVPSFSEFRNAYKELLLSQHPDKAGVGSTKRFQEITEAARIVLEYLLKNPQQQPTNETNKDILEELVAKNKLVYNLNSVTFYMTTDTFEAWKEQFEKALGSSKQLNSIAGGFQHKKSWSRDGINYGSVSLSFWPTTLKVMLQGGDYLNFTTFALPYMVENMKKTPEITQTSQINDDTENVLDIEEFGLINIDDSSSKLLIEGFRRMEVEVKTLRNELFDKIDESLKNDDKSEQVTLDSISQKLDTLETLLVDNKAGIEEVNKKLTDIVEKNTSVRMDKESVEVLAAAVSDVSGAKKTDLEEIASTLKEVKSKIDDKKLEEIVDSNKRVVEQLEGVKGLSDKFTDGLNKLEHLFEKDFLKDVTGNSAKSVDALNSMNKHMETLLSKFVVPNQVPASVSSSETTEAAVQKASVTATTDVTPANKDDKQKCRKGLFLSSSIALLCEKKKLEYELDCELEIVETYHIKETHTAPNPDKFLENMIKTHLTDGIDFLILSVGSNDITKLDTNGKMHTLSGEAVGHSHVLVELASKAADKHKIDVFVLERPARYDKKEKDPKGLRSILNDSANAMLIPLINCAENVHLVKLPSLQNLSGKAKKLTFADDGIHLTKAGSKILEDDIIFGIRSIFKDMKPKNNRSFSTPQHHDRNGGPSRRGDNGGNAGGYGRPDHRQQYGGPGGQYGGPGGRYGGPGRQYGGPGDQYGGPGGQYRRDDRNWNRDRQAGMQDMVSNFMAFMNNGPPNYRNRNRY